MDDIVDETQSGFMPNRYTFNNIRLVFGILDYSYVILDASFVLLLDFCKAFHPIEHKFIFLFFKKLFFCDTFCSAVKSLSSNANNSIRMKKDTTSTFHPNRSVRQGCPISSHLFLICTQILASYLEDTCVPSPPGGPKTVIGQMSADTDPASTFNRFNTDTALYARPLRKYNSIESHGEAHCLKNKKQLLQDLEELIPFSPLPILNLPACPCRGSVKSHFLCFEAS